MSNQEKRGNLLIEFIKRNTEWEESIQDFSVSGDKVFIIIKKKNYKVLNEIKSLAQGFGFDKLFISVEYQEKAPRENITMIYGGEIYSYSGST